MKKLIAAAAFIAARWQPAHAQTILGSIPEEFRGDWCWQENTNGEEIFRPGACKHKAGSLSIDRMTLDTGRLSCGFDSGTASEGTLNMRMLCTDFEEEQPSMYEPSSSYGLARRSNSSSSRWTNSDPRLGESFCNRDPTGGSRSTCQAARAAAAAVSDTERKRLRNIVHACGWPGAPGACRLWTGRHR